VHLGAFSSPFSTNSSFLRALSFTSLTLVGCCETRWFVYSLPLTPLKSIAIMSFWHAVSYSFSRRRSLRSEALDSFNFRPVPWSACRRLSIGIFLTSFAWSPPLDLSVLVGEAVGSSPRRAMTNLSSSFLNFSQNESGLCSPLSAPLPPHPFPGLVLFLCWHSALMILTSFPVSPKVVLSGSSRRFLLQRDLAWLLVLFPTPPFSLLRPGGENDPRPPDLVREAVFLSLLLPGCEKTRFTETRSF